MVDKDSQKKDWKKYHSQWANITEILQQIVDETELVKSFKWGGDIYTYEGKNVLAFSGFKNHYALWFHQGVFLNDEDQVLVSGSEGKTKGLRQWRFQSAEEINISKVREYILEAIQVAKSGQSITIAKPVFKNVEGILKEELEKDFNLAEAFNCLTLGRKNEYIAYIEEAKQEKTKISRLEKIIPFILEGKGLNDKYKK